MTDPPIPAKGTRDVDVKGRKIPVKMLTDAQLMLLGREARLARSPETDSERRLTAVARLFDILESVIVEPADQEYCVDLTVKGQLKLKDLTGFIDVFSEDSEEQIEQPRVRRGRPSAKRT